MPWLSLVPDVLENSGIAWPNPGMWYQLSQPFYSWASPSRLEADADPTLHAHSPRCGPESIGSLGERAATGAQSNSSFHTLMPPPPPPGVDHGGTGPKWHPMALMSDPFIGNDPCFTHSRYSTRQNEEDQLMPDYSRSMTPASSRNGASMTEHSRPPSVLPSNDRPVEGANTMIGYQNDENSKWTSLANARINSTPTMLQVQTKPSAAAEARAASYANGCPRVVSMITKEPPPTRETSDMSMKSHFSENQNTASVKSNVPSRPSPRPAGEVKGKKEGVGNELEGPRQTRKTSSATLKSKENKESSKSSKATGELGAAKRKRASITGAQKAAAQGIDLTGSSPTRKVSKKADTSDALRLEGSDDSEFARLPLELLENVL